MRTKDEVRNYFGFHPATKETAEKYDRIRGHFLDLVDKLWDELPDGPDKTTFFRQLHLSSMLAIGCVAVNETPADWNTPHIARVLPHGSVGLEQVLTDPAWKCARCNTGKAESDLRNHHYSINGTICSPCYDFIEGRRQDDPLNAQR